MEANELTALFSGDSAKLIAVRSFMPEWLEVTLPYSVLSDCFVRVFVRDNGLGQFTITDNADLWDDEYGTTAERDVSGPFLQAKELLAKNRFSCIREERGFFSLTANRKMLTASMLDMAQFIQLSVNLACLSI